MKSTAFNLGREKVVKQLIIIEQKRYDSAENFLLLEFLVFFLYSASGLVS